MNGEQAIKEAIISADDFGSPDVPPFKEGQTVRIKDNDHLGLHRVESCEWFVPSLSEPYWLCVCSEIREPIDWSKIPADATGIIVGSTYHCSAKHLIAV